MTTPKELSGSPVVEDAELERLMNDIETSIRALHYYGNPPDARLQDDVDGDVEYTMMLVKALLKCTRSPLSLPSSL